MSACELDTYTPREKSRISVFEHISNRVHDTRKDISDGNDQIGWGQVDDNGRVSKRWMTLDSRFLYIWTHVLDSMYQKEFAGKPKMDAAASAIIDSHREQYGEEKVMTENEVEDLMSREYE